jgi:hypothetical protein
MAVSRIIGTAWSSHDGLVQAQRTGTFEHKTSRVVTLWPTRISRGMDDARLTARSRHWHAIGIHPVAWPLLCDRR